MTILYLEKKHLEKWLNSLINANSFTCLQEQNKMEESNYI